MSPFLAIWDAVFSDKAKLKKAQEETKKFAQANTIKILADRFETTLEIKLTHAQSGEAIISTCIVPIFIFLDQFMITK